MKKIILGATAVALCVCLTACGNSQSNATMTSLSNQLDETSNAISNMQTVNPADINLTKSMLETIATQDNSDAIYDNVINTQQTLLNEEYYKTDILNKTSKIKNCLNKDIKLSKTQVSAVKDLTSNLNKYTNSIVYSKSEMNSSVKSIASMKKNVEKNSDKINAKLNRLACNSNSRSSYYENLLNTLNEIDSCLGLKCEESEKLDSAPVKNEDTQTESTQKGLTKNIDTYLSPTTENAPTNQEENNQEYNCPNCSPIVTPYNDGCMNNQCAPINNPVYGNNVYNRYNRFNPNRNTDTYGPTYRNIDSFGNGLYGYGMYGNGAYGYGYGMNNPYGVNGGFYNSNNMNRLATPAPVINNPATTLVNAQENPIEQRLEDFEEVKEDNTIEKLEDSAENSEKTEVEETAKVKSVALTHNLKKPTENKKTNVSTPADDLDQTIIAH